MKILMLDSSTYGEDVNVDKFYGLGEVKSYQTSTRQEALERTAGFNPDVVIINKIVADKEFIDCAPALKMIAETATGYNNIDINYAKEKNIRVANVAGYSTDSVVQHTFSLGLYLIEKMNYYDNYVKSGEYAECPIFSHFSNVFHELSGKTWGIVGLGTIGKGVAKIASDFGCKVIYYSASGKTQDVPYEREEFDEFLKKSDIISIHAPLNDKTNNLFNKEAVKYELMGYLISNNITEESHNIKFSTESEYNINRFSRLLSNVGIQDYDIEVQGNLFIITVSKKEIELLENIENLNLEQIRWLIKGVYLGAGSINNPEKKYHLEIGIADVENANQIVQYLKEFDIKSNIVEKKGEYAIYIKDGEAISKILALIGANKSVLKFEEIRVQREMNNKINRIVNCETANLNKTINASIEQIEAIKRLKSSGKFEKLDEPLKEIAELRLKNPNSNLTELGKMLKNPVGKSGVNYRLKKIMEIANEK